MLRPQLSNFQRSISEPVGPLRSINHPGNNLHSEYHKENRKCTWTCHTSEVLESQTDKMDNGIVYYIANHQMYGLLYTDFCFKLPSLICKPGYRARWCADVMYHIFQSGELFWGEVPIQTLDSYFVNAYNQAVLDSDARETVQINIGNIECLQTFNEKLPFHYCSLMLPWMYAEDPSRYFPLHYGGEHKRLAHRIKYKRSIFDLLEIRDDRDEVCKFPDGIEEVDGLPISKMRLELPKLWGEYLHLYDVEMKHNSGTLTNLMNSGMDNSILYTDVISYDSQQTYSSGDVVKIPIEIPFPIVGVIWGTTPCSDASMIKWSSLEYPGGTLFKNMPSYRTNRVYSQKHLKCMPQSPCLNYWFIGSKYRPINQNPGIIMKGGNLTLQINDMNPWPNETPSSSSVMIKVRFLVIKKFTFETFIKDGVVSAMPKATVTSE